jgi:hypothetical protein
VVSRERVRRHVANMSRVAIPLTLNWGHRVNDYGFTYHFDILAAGMDQVFGDNPVVDFEEVSCPGPMRSLFGECYCNGADYTKWNDGEDDGYAYDYGYGEDSGDEEEDDDDDDEDWE